jgi:hypothetical protein
MRHIMVWCSVWAVLASLSSGCDAGHNCEPCLAYEQVDQYLDCLGTEEKKEFADSVARDGLVETLRNISYPRSAVFARVSGMGYRTNVRNFRRKQEYMEFRLHAHDVTDQLLNNVGAYEDLCPTCRLYPAMRPACTQCASGTKVSPQEREQ